MGRGSAQSRKLLVTVHLYVGLVLGIVLSIAGLSGSLIVFWQPIDAVLNPELLAPDPVCTESAFRPIDELVAAVQAKMPPNSRLTSLDFPDQERPLLWAWYYTPTPESGWDDIYTLFVKPCSGQVTGPRLWNSQQRPWGGPLMSALIQLHTSLWLNEGSFPLGNHLLSFGSVLLMGSILVGYYLWWPNPGAWTSAFAIKRGARGRRLHYDLHKVVGAYAGGLLLLALFTAIHMYEPWTQVIDHGVNLVSPVADLNAPPPMSDPTAGGASITAGTALDIAMRKLPDARPVSIDFPADERGVYLVTLDTGAAWKTQVSIEQYSGAVLRIQGPHVASAGDHVLGWLFPLHTGQAFGLPGRIAMVVLGLVPSCVYVTGVILWWRRRTSSTK
jgi:uncharacterized iron-regulated membrane protein